MFVLLSLNHNLYVDDGNQTQLLLILQELLDESYFQSELGILAHLLLSLQDFELAIIDQSGFFKSVVGATQLYVLFIHELITFQYIVSLE